jgi:hypothetical protein
MDNGSPRSMRYGHARKVKDMMKEPGSMKACSINKQQFPDRSEWKRGSICALKRGGLILLEQLTREG